MVEVGRLLPLSSVQPSPPSADIPLCSGATWWCWCRGCSQSHQKNLDFDYVSCSPHLINMNNAVLGCGSSHVQKTSRRGWWPRSSQRRTLFTYSIKFLKQVFSMHYCFKPQNQNFYESVIYVLLTFEGLFKILVFPLPVFKAIFRLYAVLGVMETQLMSSLTVNWTWQWAWFKKAQSKICLQMKLGSFGIAQNFTYGQIPLNLDLIRVYRVFRKEASHGSGLQNGMLRCLLHIKLFLGWFWRLFFGQLERKDRKIKGDNMHQIMSGSILQLLRERNGCL